LELLQASEAAQAAQIQVFPRAVSGTRASSSALNDCSVHQQGGCFWPVARSISIAHWLSPPQSGQRWGAGNAGEELIGMAQAV
jgi:hypothetical protein